MDKLLQQWVRDSVEVFQGAADAPRTNRENPCAPYKGFWNQGPGRLPLWLYLWHDQRDGFNWQWEYRNGRIAASGHVTTSDWNAAHKLACDQVNAPQKEVQPC